MLWWTLDTVGCAWGSGAHHPAPRTFTTTNMQADRGTVKACCGIAVLQGDTRLWRA